MPTDIRPDATPFPVEIEGAYEEALDVAFETLADTPRIFGCELSELDGISHADACIALHPGIKTIIPTPTQIYFEVDEPASRELYFEAEKNPSAYESAVKICATNLRYGAPLPYLLTQFVAQNLEGSFTYKKQRGKPPDKLFGQRAYFYLLARYLADAFFNSEIARNEMTRKLSACDAVANAATALGVPITYTKVRDWCQHRDYKKMRRHADSFHDFLKDKYLHEIGLLRRFPYSRKG